MPSITSFSFIIPVYNCEKLVVECVESLTPLSKEGTLDYEIALIDDGSSDESAVLCDELAQSFPTIVVHQNNRGVSAARNVGLNLSVCDFISFVDSDDILCIEKLVPVLRILFLNRKIDMAVYGIEFEFYKKGECYQSYSLLPTLCGVTERGEWLTQLDALFDANALSSACTRIIRREILEEENVRFKEDLFLYEDLDFCLRTLARCNQVLFYQEAVYRYRQTINENGFENRICRVDSISSLVNILDQAGVALSFDMSHILISVFLFLARGKIARASNKGITAICEDFSNWIDKRKLLPRIENNSFAMLLYRHDVGRLITKRCRANVRVRIVWVLRECAMYDYLKRIKDGKL